MSTIFVIFAYHRPLLSLLLHIQKSHLSIRIRLPAIHVKVFSLLIESDNVPVQLTQLEIASDSLVILTGKRPDGLHLVAKTNFIKFTTKKNLSHCIALYPVSVVGAISDLVIFHYRAIRKITNHPSFQDERIPLSLYHFLSIFLVRPCGVSSINVNWSF